MPIVGWNTMTKAKAQEMRKRPTPELVLVTAVMAADWLTRNACNRPIQWTYVKHLARLMRDGLFEDATTDGIGIRTDGQLTNGQHRLLAIKETGLSQWLIVVRGVSPEAYRVTDRGKNRSLSDVLQLPKHLIADANLLGMIMGKPRMSEVEVQDVVTWWRPAHDALGHAIGGKFEAGFASASFRVGCGVRWATEPTAAGRTYVLKQYRATSLSQAPDMSAATTGRFLIPPSPKSRSCPSS